MLYHQLMAAMQVATTADKVTRPVPSTKLVHLPYFPIVCRKCEHRLLHCACSGELVTP